MAKCPYCEGEMKKGCIEADGRSGIIWQDGERIKRNFISKFLKEDYIMLKGKGFIKTRVEAEYCEVCRKIVIDIKE